MESPSEDTRSSRSPSIPTASADAIAAVASCRRAITSDNCMVPSTIHLVLRPTPIKHGASNDAASIDGRIPLVLTANSSAPIHGIWTYGSRTVRSVAHRPHQTCPLTSALWYGRADRQRSIGPDDLQSRPLLI